MDIWQLDTETVEPHHPRILRTDEGANRVVLLTLPAGEMLQEHRVRERALVFLVGGEILLRHEGEERAVTAPALMHFEPSEDHEVEATADSRLAICLAPWPGGGYHDE